MSGIKLGIYDMKKCTNHGATNPISHSFFPFRSVLVEHQTVYLQPGQLKTLVSEPTRRGSSSDREVLLVTLNGVLTVHVWMVC